MFARTTIFTVFAALLPVSVASADVRVVHASPDAPNVDVIVNDDFANPAFSNAPFTGVTNYVPLPTATYNFKVVPSGATMPVVIDADVAIDGNTDYSIVATNTLANIEPWVLVDDNTSNPDMARVRFVHASPDAPTVDVAVAGGGPILFDDVSFQDAPIYQMVAPGTYDLEVQTADNSAAVLPVSGVTLEAGFVYTVFAVGFATPGSDPGLSAVLSVDAVPEPSSLALLGLASLFALRRR